MTRKEFLAIAERVRLGIASDDEVRLYMQWFDSFQQDANWDTQTMGEAAEIKAELDERILSHFEQKDKPIRRLWTRWATAASLSLLLISFAVYFISRHKPEATQTIAKQDRQPGKHTATLTLANGQKIVLSQAANGLIASQAGSTITKTADGQLVYSTEKELGEMAYNLLTTAIGETYKLQLPDGSVVWLNANSSLRYPAVFNGKERLVELTGEAYFEVVHNTSKPFRVKSSGQTVEDIGTHFNINSYKDETAIATTLLEGAVKVEGSNNDSQILKPGQQAINNGQSIKVEPANGEAITDWKDGKFYLYHQDFKVVMRKIARWYDIEVVYDENVPADIQSWGWIPRNTPLSVVLKSIESSGLAHFRLEGRKLYVSK